jgi:hypothetical protein
VITLTIRPAQTAWPSAPAEPTQPRPAAPAGLSRLSARSASRPAPRAHSVRLGQPAQRSRAHSVRLSQLAQRPSGPTPVRLGRPVNPQGSTPPGSVTQPRAPRPSVPGLSQPAQRPEPHPVRLGRPVNPQGSTPPGSVTQPSAARPSAPPPRPQSGSAPDSETIRLKHPTARTRPSHPAQPSSAQRAGPCPRGAASPSRPSHLAQPSRPCPRGTALPPRPTPAQPVSAQLPAEQSAQRERAKPTQPNHQPGRLAWRSASDVDRWSSVFRRAWSGCAACGRRVAAVIYTSSFSGGVWSADRACSSEPRPTVLP